MSRPDLREINWKPRYSGEADDLLKDFYIPALQRSLFYDRKAGFFSSTALAVAAQGVSRLIANGGRMRLIVGCVLSPDDARAIKEGYDLRKLVEERLSEHFPLSEGDLRDKRIEALAWMVAEGTLDVKVAIPKGEDGKVLPADEAEGMFHEKVGIFADAAGNRLAFSGSVNESAHGWLKNLESFHVFKSWEEDAVHVASETDDFDRLWNGLSRRAIVIDLPEALIKELIKMVPFKAPFLDPLEEMEEGEDPERIDLEEECERWFFQFLRDAPYLETGWLLGETTGALKLWPHQEKVVKEILSRYPERFLLCDEVGLGKTIEAGAALRSLILSGAVKRCLILVPKGLLPQWQDELKEKFNLSVPRYTGSDFVDAYGKRSPANISNPWNTYPVMLASSHLAKRKDRQPDLLRAADWDLIIVDEAHHGRRKAPTGDEYRPNNLLRLLSELEKKTKGLLLMTATPMQIDAIELWDLLKVLGMGGLWGSGQGRPFKEYFRQLRLFLDGADTRFLLSMAEDYLRNGGKIDRALEEQAHKEIGLISWNKICQAATSPATCLDLEKLDAKERAYCSQFLARHTPLRRFMMRNTRELLRKYREKGLLKEKIPRREVGDCFIELEQPEEQALYDRIDDYIQAHRMRAEIEGNKGLGFLSTVYRRRLTSSPYAVSQSLKRRLDFLRGATAGDTPGGLTDEDVEDEELDRDLIEEESSSLIEKKAEEADYIDEFLADIETSGQDSKFKKLTEDLQSYLKVHPRVIIFTQYSDTMDYVKKELATIYGSQIACYSGRGGEFLEDGHWVETTKEIIKKRFLFGDEIKMLVCTDAASEGLNLQTCGLLINYDMPWNPMKVEQRIGRIDRIGQVFDKVTILNYFYDGTVEAEIYKRLSDRISLFEAVVGELQPILARIANAIEEAVFTSREERGHKLDQIVKDLKEKLDRMETEGLRIDDYVEQRIEGGYLSAQPPVTLKDIESLFLLSAAFKNCFIPDSQEPGLYELIREDIHLKVTFDPEIYEAMPETVRYLSYGDSIFEDMLRKVKEPRASRGFLPLIRVTKEKEGVRSVGYFWIEDNGTNAIEIKDISSIRAYFDMSLKKGFSKAVLAEEKRNEINQLIKLRLDALLQKRSEVLNKRRDAEYASLRAEAEAFLYELLAVEYVREVRMSELEISEETANLEDFLKLKIRDRVVPYPAIAQIIGKAIDNLDFSKCQWQKYLGSSIESLNAKSGAVKRKIRDIIEDYKATKIK